jgi:hypothetical protein
MRLDAVAARCRIPFEFAFKLGVMVEAARGFAGLLTSQHATFCF